MKTTIQNLKISLLAIFVVLLSCFCISCTNQNEVEISKEGYPNIAVENAKISNKYADQVNELSKEVKQEFIQQSKIPHQSGHVEKIRQYLLDWAKTNGINAHLDKSGCVYYDIPASNNYEQYPTIILQGHMDMVVTADSTYTNFDPVNSSIEVSYDKESGKFTSKDNKTSIGADDGQAIGIMMAIAKSKDIKHGPIRMLFTYDEETNCEGAKTLSPEVLNSDYLINIDGVRAGEVIISSAGYLGRDLGKKFELSNLESGMRVCKVNVNKLQGGHSGIDIHKAKKSGSALLVDVLSRLKENNIKYQIAEIDCGNALNAIPNTISITIAIPDNNADSLDNILKDIENDIHKKCEEEKEFNISCENNTQDNTQFVSVSDSAKILEMLSSLSNGVIKMSEQIDGMTETSQNIGIVKLKNGEMKLGFSYRSNNEDSINEGRKLHDNFINKYQLENKVSGETYTPAWSNISDDKLANLYIKAMKDECNLKAYKNSVHASLETAFFVGKHPGINIICIGCDVVDEHTLQETFYTKSIPAVLASLLNVFENISSLE